MSTPSSDEPPPTPTVAVFGAGIAGLTAAHELSRLGYAVSVYEADDLPGGFFRSARRKPDNMPTEYSWHGMGPWYHNVFDLFKQIPFDETATLYEKALSRPIDFGIFPENGTAGFYDHGLRSIPGMFEISRWEWAKATWLMLKTWTAHRRTEEHYATLNAAEQWKPLLRERGYINWRACFGPWIGSDWTKVSMHTAGQFFRKQLITQPPHHHPADDDGPAWTQGAGDGWLLLRGPSNEIWFEKWVRTLASAGVRFHWDAPLVKLDFDGTKITGAQVESVGNVNADYYVLATTPFAAAEIVARTPGLEHDAEMRRFKPLIQDGPHVQVSFRVAFHEPINFPRERMAVVVSDSEFNITLFAQEQAWLPEVDLGEGIGSLWTATSCAAHVPGRLYGLPVRYCTREQFVEEVKAQILSCQSLNKLIMEANGDRGLDKFPIKTVEVWREWQFSPEGISGPQPKWVTTTNTQPHLPNQRTGISNLFLAGAHTRTQADVWSIEGAVESGRRAAKAIDPRVRVLPQYTPRLLDIIGAIDDLCYRVGLPHILDLSPFLLVLAFVLMLVLTQT
ncbi:MAG: FAD-dependent oxidoreductase [Candidatus Hydrogenedentales bacterium]